MGVSPTNLTLPRMVVGTFATMQALGKRGVASPGMFVINLEDDHLYQWVMDHWEGIGAWRGGKVDDPLAAYQLGHQGWGSLGGSGGHASGGGGGTPPPGGPGINPINTPLAPTFVVAGANDVGAVQHGPAVPQNITAADGLLLLSTLPLSLPAHPVMITWTIPLFIGIVVAGSWELNALINGVPVQPQYPVVAAGGVGNETNYDLVLFGPTSGPFLGQFHDGDTLTVTFRVIAGTYALTSRGGFVSTGGYA